MAQKAKCASGWKVTISASPQPSSSSDRSASDRLESSSSSASASSTSGANATVSARLSVECSFLEEARSVKTTSCRQNLYILVIKNFFHGCLYAFKAGPPLDLSFWSFSTFLHHGIDNIETHLLWKFYKTIRRKSWSNVPPKVVACIGFLYKVVHKIGRLRKFNRSREIEFNFFTAWTIFMKFGTLVQHAPGYKTLPQIF